MKLRPFFTLLAVGAGIMLTEQMITMREVESAQAGLYVVRAVILGMLGIIGALLAIAHRPDPDHTRRYI